MDHDRGWRATETRVALAASRHHPASQSLVVTEAHAFVQGAGVAVVGHDVQERGLAATDLGLASCVLGWFDEKIVRSVLMPEDKDAARLLICVGYAKDGTTRPKARKPLSEIVRFLD